MSDEVFAAGDTLVQELQNLEKAGYGKLQNLAGRQRALSQRMARDYFVMRIGDGSHWKTNGPAMRKQFGETLQALEAAPLTTAAIKDNLGLVKMQWMLFEEALNNPGDEKSPAHVATTSERMFEVLDTLVDQYEHAMQALA
ncbi:MAG TPA: hypothetical protein VFP68_18800 [Burkholderiaceae bacterium]|nr:hypothetical protein [Burkholderiaceae bacterium]